MLPKQLKSNYTQTYVSWLSLKTATPVLVQKPPKPHRFESRLRCGQPVFDRGLEHLARDRDGRVGTDRNKKDQAKGLQPCEVSSNVLHPPQAFVLAVFRARG